MKKTFLLLISLFFCSAMAMADNGPFHFQRVVNSATSVTSTASAWTLLTGSKVASKKIMIAEDTRSLKLLIAFSAANTTNASYWLQTPADGIFDQPVQVDPAFGIMIGTTLTGGTLPAATVRLMLDN
jgi:hypothetical protein